MDSTLDLKHYLKLLAGGLIALVLGAFVWEWITSPMIVTVTGVGTKTVPASSAALSLVVTANDVRPGDAIIAVKAKADALRNHLISKGVLADDIVESQISVVPASSVVAGASGYQASISMGAKTADVISVNDLVASLYANDAALVSQPVVTAENQDKLAQEALDEAMKDADKQAGLVAAKNWKLIRKIIAMAQASSPSSTTVTSRNDLQATGAEQAASKGVFKITQAVSVSYKMW